MTNNSVMKGILKDESGKRKPCDAEDDRSRSRSNLHGQLLTKGNGSVEPSLFRSAIRDGFG